MNWKQKGVFVTGAGGFIGSHLCEKLVEMGARVTALVRYNSRGQHGFLEDAPAEIRKEIEVVLGDIRDESVFRAHLEEKNIVFHLAAIPGIPYSFIYPRDVFEINAVGSLNLLNMARELPLDKIILASSAETYGDSRYTPMDEEHPQFPKSPYAASKAAMEKLAWSFYYAYESPVTIVRLFNNYGPRQSARAITPTIITQMLDGNEIRVGALDPRRDFTFVLDTVEAFVKLGASGGSGEVFNIGSGVDISVREIIETVAKILGKRDISIVTEKARMRPKQSEVGMLRANSERLRRATGWRPKFSYEQGLTMTIDWISKHIDSYKPEVYSI